MPKRLVSLVLCVLFYIVIMPSSAVASNMLVNSGFEDDGEVWQPCIFSNEHFYEGRRSGALSNPLGPPVGGSVPHVSDYIHPVFLEEGTLYKISAFVRCDDGGTTPAMGDVHFSRSANRIVFNIKNVPCEWTEVSGFFVAGKSGKFDLGVILYGNAEDTIFYMDSISLVSLPNKPVSMDLFGPRNVLIPSVGHMSYEYTAVAIDKSGVAIPILTGSIQLTTSLPSGISFDSETLTLTVDSSTLPGTMIKLRAAPPAGSGGVASREITIFADFNYITNGTFEDLPQYSSWETEDSSFSIENGSAKINMIMTEDNECMGKLTASKTVVLQNGVMYVLRARVRSDSPYESRQVVMSSPIVGADGIINVTIQNTSHDWTRVFSVIRVPDEGIYQLKLNFLESEEFPVYIDDIGLFVETSHATDVIFSAPAHVSIPHSGELRVPINYAVRDQESRILPGEPVSATVEPKGRGVYLEGKNLVVTKAATQSSYKIIAISESDDNIRGSHTVNISNESVGDGSFENQAPGQWWASAPPSKFNIITGYDGRYPSHGEKLGRLTLNGSVSALLCDSYRKYSASVPYVFEAMMVKTVPDIDTTVTLIIENASGNSFEDNLIVSQFSLSAQEEQIRRVFTSHIEIDGRLMIAYNTPVEHDSQVVLLDDIKISDANVSASNVRITGLPNVDMVLTGRYSFSSNFGATDTSSYRWLASSTQNGAYIPIAGQTGQTLSVTPDLIDKFVKFEITPSSLAGPVFGQSVASAPLRIQIVSTGGIGGNTGSEEYEQEEVLLPDNPIAVESDLVINCGGELSIYNIYKVTPGFYEHTFFDMKGHWAYNDVRLMSAVGIANGRGGGLFMPSEFITRAEFCAFMVRAFAMAPIRYSGGFTDVEQWAWYSGIIETVTKHDIAQGTGEGIFGPEVPITREQMTAMIMRAYQKTNSPLATGNVADFTDEEEISSWAAESVKNAAALDIIMGMADGSFKPKVNATRAEAIVSIKRMIKVMLDKYAEGESSVD